MPIRMKPKTYGPVFVRAAADGTLCYGDGESAIDRQHPPAGSPAEILLASIGACMVLSIGIVARHGKTELTPFWVEVRATKSEEPPSHFGRYTIRVGGGPNADPAVAEALARSAKGLCTISNSLNGEIDLIVDPA